MPAVSKARTDKNVKIAYVRSKFSESDIRSFKQLTFDKFDIEKGNGYMTSGIVTTNDLPSLKLFDKCLDFHRYLNESVEMLPRLQAYYKMNHITTNTQINNTLVVVFISCSHRLKRY